MTSLQLRQKRAALVEANGALLERAKRENRSSLTPSETTEFDRRDEEIVDLGKQIARVESHETHIAELAATQGRVAGPYRAARSSLGSADTNQVSGDAVAMLAPLMSIRGFESVYTETRAMGNAGAGATMVPEEWVPRVWSFLAANSVAVESGMTVIPTRRDVLHIPTTTSDATAAWVSEAGTIAASDPGYSEKVATPRKLAARVVISNELINDGDPLVLSSVQDGLIRALALKMDLGVIEGSGTAPEIRGIKNTASIQQVSMGVNGGSFSNLDPFADAIGLLGEANANASAIVMHPRTWKALTKLKETGTSTKPLLQEEAGGPTAELRRSIYGVPVYLSSGISVTETQGTSGAVCSSAYVYQANQGIVVRRQEIRVELDRSRLFDLDQSEVRAIARVDFVAPNPTAFVRILGIL